MYNENIHNIDLSVRVLFADYSISQSEYPQSLARSTFFVVVVNRLMLYRFVEKAYISREIQLLPQNNAPLVLSKYIVDFHKNRKINATDI